MSDSEDNYDALFPKYWDQKLQEVVTGVDIRFDTPTKLDDVVGKYFIAYSGDPHFPGDVEEMSKMGYDNVAEFLERHTLTLGAPEGEAVTLANAQGRINWGTVSHAYTGMERLREKWSADESVPWLESYWRIIITEDENEEGWLDHDDNAIGVMKVNDDNGCPFLCFDWSHPPGCHSSWSGYYVCKKMVKGKSWRLTEREKARLGIDMSKPRVERLAKGENASSDEDEDGTEEEDGGSQNREDEDSKERPQSGKKREADEDDSRGVKRARGCH